MEHVGLAVFEGEKLLWYAVKKFRESRISTTKTLSWMLSEQYLNRRNRADSFVHFQTPVYYPGKRGWYVVGKPASEYRAYRLQIEQTPERTFPHTLALYSVLVKFLMEAEVRRIIPSEPPAEKPGYNIGLSGPSLTQNPRPYLTKNERPNRANPAT
jgi:hypothetical protein